MINKTRYVQFVSKCKKSGFSTAVIDRNHVHRVATPTFTRLGDGKEEGGKDKRRTLFILGALPIANHSASMKVLVALFVFAACGAVRASDPALSQLWHAGAVLVGPPVTEVSVDGEQLRNDTITAIDNYLIKLDSDIERQFAWGVNEILQPCGLRFREIIDMQILVTAGIASPDQFDYQLWYLTRSYDTVVQLVREGEGSLMRLSSEQSQLGHDSKAAVPEFASPRYTLNQLFYGFDKAVIDRDFGILRKWLLDTFDAGHKVVHDAVPVIEENHRQSYMWPMVRSLQRDAITVAVYDVPIQAHSATMYWSEYLRARNDLLSL
ncbi:hypothetical protein R5R35_000718 [Gryllus longicercus]|uniref:Uncharacterized protein n=1 Tax=Gryllus longicercus TaxID=2509291 RepID=A0AAN9VZ29_9ORTH